MKIKVKITGINYVNEIESYWTNDDFISLLKAFDFDETDSVPVAELREMLYMAMTDFEPADAARILLEYRLGDQLNEGQIQSLSHEMIEDKVAEEYPDPELHYDLFNINQLLFKAFSGTFPNTEASIIGVEIDKSDLGKLEMTEEIMTKLISGCLSEKSIINRLYSDQIDGKEPFEDAAKFIWKLTKTSDCSYDLVTSRYWIEKEDIIEMEYTKSIVIAHEDD